MDNKIWILINALVAILLVDVAVGRTYRFFNNQLNLDWFLFIFVSLFCTFTVIQYFLIKFAKANSVEITSKSKSPIISRLNKIIMTSQLSLIFFVIVVIAQMVCYNYYNSYIIELIIFQSFGLEIFMLSMLVKKLFSWYALTHSPIVLLYGLSSMFITVAGIFTVSHLTVMFTNTPDKISFSLQGYTMAISGNLLIEVFKSGFFVTNNISFVAMWITTIVLLRHYSNRVGKIRYGLIVAIPLIFYVSQFITTNSSIASSIVNINPVIFISILSILYSLSLPIGGMLFGTIFRVMAKAIGKESNSGKNYLMMCAYGIVLIFVSGQIVVTQINYPPFGLLNLAFTGMASYILFIGFYSTAISASIDRRILESMHDSILQKIKLLDSFAEGHKSESILKDVIEKAFKEEKKLENETGISSTLSDEETKSYLEEIFLEIKNSKRE